MYLERRGCYVYMSKPGLWNPMEIHRVVWNISNTTDAGNPILMMDPAY